VGEVKKKRCLASITIGGVKVRCSLDNHPKEGHPCRTWTPRTHRSFGNTFNGNRNVEVHWRSNH
jgi:hypothetical protein